MKKRRRKKRVDLSHTSSPKSKDKGCLCSDGTYSTECCDGEVASQGIGSVDGDNGVSNKTDNSNTRSTSVERS